MSHSFTRGVCDRIRSAELQVLLRNGNLQTYRCAPGIETSILLSGVCSDRQPVKSYLPEDPTNKDETREQTPTPLTVFSLKV